MTAEKKKEKQKRYYQKHKEILKQKAKEKAPERREYQKKYQKEYRKTPSGRAQQLLNSYKEKDTKNNRGECTITKLWILENIFTSSCTYCGESDWKKLGCDRIDNTLPHTPENCVCSCWNCNNERKNKYSVEEFKEYKQKGQPPIEPPCHNSTPLN